MNEEERGWSGCLVGEGDAQLIRGRSSTNEERLWGDLSALTNYGRRLVVWEVAIEPRP